MKKLSSLDEKIHTNTPNAVSESDFLDGKVDYGTDDCRIDNYGTIEEGNYSQEIFSEPMFLDNTVVTY